MSSLFLCFFLSFFSFLFLHSSSTTITLSLSPNSLPNANSNSHSNANSWEFISHIAKSTLQRAHHLKHPKKKPSTLHGNSSTELYARSYGGYTISLAFGTPPQAIPLVFDTGSSLVWVPCTSRYSCSKCTFSHVNPKNITTFKPKLSSSTKIIGCRNEKCGWLYGPDVAGRCADCGPNVANCTKPCPSYVLQYGLGATAGVLISETLDLKGKKVRDVFIGCSLLSVQQPEGIAGFGRAADSLPNQLKLRKFSHCLLSHRFDDTSKSSKLVLSGGRKNSSKTSEVVKGVKYTPFRKNPDFSPYDEYYYVNLRRITVGKKQIKVKIPYRYLVPDINGTGGVIVDSGSTLTFMDRPVFDPLVKELVAQLGHVKRSHKIEALSGFGLCLDLSSSRNISIPELVFHFKGGAKMDLGLENYFSFINDMSTLCLTIVTDKGPAAPEGTVGPAMILGNYQQMNFYIEYDLEHQRMGFKKLKCG